MSWFQLDHDSIATRARSVSARAPSLTTSLLRGIFGFTLVSLVGFVPWAVFGGWFRQHGGGEIGMYIACAFVFLGLSGLVLHPLIIGPGSLPRFYKVFTIAFTLYSIAWIAGWMTLRGHPGSIVGLFSGTLLMGLVMAAAFGAMDQAVKVVLALFLLNSAGCFIGGWVEGILIPMKQCNIFGVALAGKSHVILAKSMWGVFYGIGLGAGLAVAFHLCQTRARALLAK